MCGHVGMAGDLSMDAEKAFRTLLIFDVVRGEHSTGVAGVGKYNNEVTIAKQLGNPFELFNDTRYDRVSKTVNKVLIGHNRYATQGSVTKRNAHPFEYGTVVGAHNGTVSNKGALVDGSKFDVDSQAILNSIDTVGVEKTISVLRGAWALVWWDMADESINFIRNSERTLYICWSTDKKMMFWASEAWMLDIALARNNIKHEKPAMLAEDSWLSIPVGDRGVLGKGVVKKIHGPKPQQYPIIYRNHHGYGNANGNANSQSSSTTSSETSKTSNVVAFPERTQQKSMPSGYLGSKKRMFELGAKGTTNDGATYIVCEDPMFLDYDVRLFLGKHDTYVTGDIITGDISSWDPKIGCFKVSPITVEVVTIEQAEEQLEKEDRYYDHKGNPVTKAEFEKRYAYCSWCSDSINADDEGLILTNGGDCLCPSCAKNPEVAQYI